VAAAISSRSRAASPIPGDALLHPAALLSIAVLVVNDHVLKAAWPGLVTGKLSDFAGMVFFPLLMVAVMELCLSALARRPVLSHRHLELSIVATGVVFAGVKLVPEVNSAFAWLLGAAQWLAGVFLGGTTLHLAPTEIVPDTSDIIALPLLALSYGIGMRRYADERS
jgi:hypothetical protein